MGYYSRRQGSYLNGVEWDPTRFKESLLSEWSNPRLGRCICKLNKKKMLGNTAPGGWCPSRTQRAWELISLCTSLPDNTSTKFVLSKEPCSEPNLTGLPGLAFWSLSRGSWTSVWSMKEKIKGKEKQKGGCGRVNEHNIRSLKGFHPGRTCCHEQA